MNGKDLLMVVEVVSNEKGVDREVVFKAIESALAAAAKKSHGGDIDVRVSIDRQSGEYSTFRRWEAVPDEAIDHDDLSEVEREAGVPVLESHDRQLRLGEARQRVPGIQVGEFVEEPMISAPFGRIGAQAAKQVIMQQIREAERAMVVEAYRSRVGELVAGIVKRMDRGSIILDLGGNAEAMVPREHAIPREAVRNGDRVRGYLYEVRPEPRGPQIFISRTCPEFLIELFKLEVPEVGQGLIEILGAARDPGSRAKIAVHSHDPRIDPVGACVGMRGSRVQAVSNELAGERIDIIPWTEEPASFVVNAMQPAEVVSIVMDEEAHSMDIAVREEQLSQAIGRGGQNIRLASQLTGWDLNVMSEAQAIEKSESETQATQKLFMQQLDVDEEIAAILVQEGFSSLEEVAYVPVHEMSQIEEFDVELVEELRNRAREALLTQAIKAEEEDDAQGPADDLLNMEGMDTGLARTLAAHKVRTMEDLADLAVDDLLDIADMDRERAAALIMTARAPLFAEN